MSEIHVEHVVSVGDMGAPTEHYRCRLHLLCCPMDPQTTTCTPCLDVVSLGLYPLRARPPVDCEGCRERARELEGR